MPPEVKLCQPSTPEECLTARYLEAAGGNADAALRFAVVALEVLALRLEGAEREVSAGFVRRPRAEQRG